MGSPALRRRGPWSSVIQMVLPALRVASLALVCIMAVSCATGSRPGDDAMADQGVPDTKKGARAAQRDLAEGRYQIVRYDQPPFRTGNWTNYNANFERFGIRQMASLDSKEYCDAYNKVMDRALLKKFGGPYRKVRSRILPAPDAVPYLHFN